MVNGKQKGAGWEREVCKRLSLWLSHDQHEDLLWRSSMSGGRSTVAYAKGKRLAAQAGDISAVHALGMPLTTKFCVECKSYKDLEITGLLTNRGKLVQFWDIICKEATRYDKAPMLIAKQNQKPAIMCLHPDEMRKFGLEPILVASQQDLAIVLFDDFLAKANPCIA